MSIFGFQVSFEQIYYSFTKKPDKIFWTNIKEMIFAIARK